MAVGVLFALLLTLLRFTLYNYKNGNMEASAKKGKATAAVSSEKPNNEEEEKVAGSEAEVAKKEDSGAN